MHKLNLLVRGDSGSRIADDKLIQFIHAQVSEYGLMLIGNEAEMQHGKHLKNKRYSTADHAYSTFKSDTTSGAVGRKGSSK
ncbi:hypothetical protein VNO80_21711 [Phaseolus coccineus]|uniref:Uncharacterized protein n=1 Tax=Phaseolus coccineus TaxID=3886 RepID=A0AAN9M6N2_PHACN